MTVKDVDIKIKVKGGRKRYKRPNYKRKDVRDSLYLRLFNLYRAAKRHASKQSPVTLEGAWSSCLASELEGLVKAYTRNAAESAPVAPLDKPPQPVL